jgi:hypothetical protein
MPSRQILAGIAATAFAWGSQASACQMNWKGPGEPDIVSMAAYLVISSGDKVKCEVVKHYLLELEFKLVCANGATVEIGRSPYCGRGPLAWPDCDYGLLVDKSGQAFKLRENAYPFQTTCSGGLAKTMFGFQLSQATFNFEAFVEVTGRQQVPKKPVGF